VTQFTRVHVQERGTRPSSAAPIIFSHMSIDQFSSLT
jgi:hypothetical protein